MDISQEPTPLPADLTDSTSFILVVEPYPVGRHVYFKTTYHYWNRQGEKTSMVSIVRDQFRVSEEINTILIAAGPDPICEFNLHRKPTKTLE